MSLGGAAYQVRSTRSAGSDSPEVASSSQRRVESDSVRPRWGPGPGTTPTSPLQVTRAEPAKPRSPSLRRRQASGQPEGAGSCSLQQLALAAAMELFEQHDPSLGTC